MTNVRTWQKYGDDNLVKVSIYEAVVANYFKDEDGYWHDEPLEFEEDDEQFLDVVFSTACVIMSCESAQHPDMPHLSDVEGGTVIVEYLEREEKTFAEFVHGMYNWVYDRRNEVDWEDCEDIDENELEDFE